MGLQKAKLLRVLSFWKKERKCWAYGDLNARPLDYESSALTGLSYRPVVYAYCFFPIYPEGLRPKAACPSFVNLSKVGAEL